MEVSIAILSDTQRTLGIERWVLGRKQYEYVRRRLVLDLLERRPSILILNGDLTALGSSEEEWKHWLQWMQPLLNSGVEIWPVMGNHDYLLNRRRASALFELHFPGFTPPIWYMKRAGRTAIVMVDSNQWAMTRENWNKQSIWFNSTISDLERDDEIDRIWVMSHYPCQTVPILPTVFFASRKTEVWISGHLHKREDKELNGKRLITFGGGGGPPHKQNINQEFGYILALPYRETARIEDRIYCVRV